MQKRIMERGGPMATSDRAKSASKASEAAGVRQNLTLALSSQMALKPVRTRLTTNPDAVIPP